MKLYKLTDEHGRTRRGLQWGAGIEHIARSEGPLCEPEWLRAYTHPLLALLLNPIYANFLNPQLWEADGGGGVAACGLMVGCTHLTTIRLLDAPTITTEQRIRFAIGCAASVHSDLQFLSWGQSWISDSDRTAGSAAEAEAAAWAARAEAWAAWAAVEVKSAAWMARAVARAAESAMAANANLDITRIAEWAMSDESLDALLAT